MKFRLISRQGIDEGTGEIADPFAGPVEVLVWAGRTFLAAETEELPREAPRRFREVLGQALDHHQVTPPPKVAERWTSPTAIGRMAEKAPDVVDSVAPGYVLNPALVREIGEPGSDKALWAMGDPEATPEHMLGLKPVPVLHEGASFREAIEKCNAAQDQVKPRRRRGEPS